MTFDEILTDVVKTICGYTAKELVFFAQVCREKGIADDDLHNFCVSAENGWLYGWEEFNRAQNKAIQEQMERYKKAVTDDT